MGTAPAPRRRHRKVALRVALAPNQQQPPGGLGGAGVVGRPVLTAEQPLHRSTSDCSPGAIAYSLPLSALPSVGESRLPRRERRGRRNLPSRESTTTEVVGEQRSFRQAPTSFSRTDLLRIVSVEPFSTATWRLRKSARTRVTVSRDVPMICAISSWVSASLTLGSA